MAILQAAIAEDLLSKQERYVLRNIVKVSQLSEGLMSLKKAKDSLDQSTLSVKTRYPDLAQSLQSMDDYLSNQICKTISTIRLPEASNASDTKSPSSTEAS